MSGGWLGNVYGQALSQGVMNGLEPYLEEQRRRKRQEADLEHRLNAEQKVLERHKEAFAKELAHKFGHDEQGKIEDNINSLLSDITMTNPEVRQGLGQSHNVQSDNKEGLVDLITESMSSISNAMSNQGDKLRVTDNNATSDNLAKKAVQQAYQQTVLDSVPKEYGFTRDLIRKQFAKENIPTLPVGSFSQSQELDNLLKNYDLSKLKAEKKAEAILDGIHSQRALDSAIKEHFPEYTYRQELITDYDENNRPINKLYQSKHDPSGKWLEGKAVDEFKGFDKAKHELDMLDRKLEAEKSIKALENIKNNGMKPKDILDYLINSGIDVLKYPDLPIIASTILSSGTPSAPGEVHKLVELARYSEPNDFYKFINSKSAQDYYKAQGIFLPSFAKYSSGSANNNPTSTTTNNNNVDYDKKTFQSPEEEKYYNDLLKKQEGK